MSGLNIALIRQKYTASGGAERFVAQAMRELAKQGCTVTVVTRQWERTSGQAVVELAPAYWGSTWRDWGFARAVCRHLQTSTYDLVQSHERLECCDVFRAGDGVHREWLAQRAQGLSTMRRAAMFMNPHHRYLLHAEQRMFESPRLRAVICNSRMVKDEILLHYRIDEAKLKVIYNGVDLEAFQPSLRASWRDIIRSKLGIPNHMLTILHVGSGFERKGVAVLLRAVASAPITSHFIVLGRDKREPLYRKLAAKLGIESRVHFMGAQADPKPYYAAADVFAMASLYEPFANASMEALAMGLPVLTSTKSGTAEILENRKTGYVCDARDVAGFAAAIRELADDGKRLAMGIASRRLAERFSLAAMTQQLLQLYERLLSRPAIRDA
ncbi:MAG: glycosyltransferase family 4 protein [Burkholderiales bacterium]